MISKKKNDVRRLKIQASAIHKPQKLMVKIIGDIN